MNYPLFSSGQQAVTATAEPLPTFGPVNPFAGSVAGEGILVTLVALKGNSNPIYYGGSGVTDATGCELAPGTSSPAMKVNNLYQIFVIAGETGNTVSWIVTNP